MLNSDLFIKKREKKQK